MKFISVVVHASVPRESREKLYYTKSKAVLFFRCNCLYRNLCCLTLQTKFTIKGSLVGFRNCSMLKLTEKAILSCFSTDWNRNEQRLNMQFGIRDFHSIPVENFYVNYFTWLSCYCNNGTTRLQWSGLHVVFHCFNYWVNGFNCFRYLAGFIGLWWELSSHDQCAYMSRYNIELPFLLSLGHHFSTFKTHWPKIF